MPTDERLEKLERRYRLLVALGTCALLFAVALTWTASKSQAQPTEKVIVANKFVVQDENGMPRAGMALGKNGQVLNLP